MPHPQCKSTSEDAFLGFVMIVCLFMAGCEISSIPEDTPQAPKVIPVDAREEAAQFLIDYIDQASGEDEADHFIRGAAFDAMMVLYAQPPPKHNWALSDGGLMCTGCALILPHDSPKWQAEWARYNCATMLGTTTKEKEE
jgi:hypothetical protein